ncbi:DUF3575 domain-containing protein [Cytophaga aurantiaca]|uniref:DUF3575 domain-containing protein n=1 Tax=Cytophaga aurantiaca TaxID=29530 RepID=UPI00035FDAD8|nr:DUF3575 domain-containing protein [Cytophaga aurantiaca]
MKKAFLISLSIALHSYCFAQSTDSSNVISKSHKNNIQIGVPAPIGFFVLQFEKALTKRISFNTIAFCDYQYYSKDHPIDYSIGLMPQLRWYTQKKKGYNQGFYISVSATAFYEESYASGSYNPQTGDIQLNSSDLNPGLHPGYYYEDNIIKQQFGVYAGPGIGYQWLVKKRFIIDLNYNIQYAFFQRERYKNLPVQNEWQKPERNTKDFRSYMIAPLLINIGYAF